MGAGGRPARPASRNNAGGNLDTAGCWDAATRAQEVESRVDEISSLLKAAVDKTTMRISEVFHEWDKDGSGAIDRKELSVALKGLGIKASKEEVECLFARWDTDQSGEVRVERLWNEQHTRSP